MFVSKATRRAIYERDDYTCHYCQEEVFIERDCGGSGHPRRATLDHKRPRARGGLGTKQNLVTACAQCNVDKGDLDYEVFLWYRQMIAQGHGRTEVMEAIAEYEARGAAT